MSTEALLLDERWEVVSTYSRAQALEDGLLVDVTETAKEAGFIYPFALTRAVHERYVKVPQGLAGQDEQGRLWDILFLLRIAIETRTEPGPVLFFELLVQTSRQRSKLVKLKSHCGPGDHDAKPVITIMLPEEA